MPGCVGDHNRVDAVLLTPHDVVEHLRQVDRQARAPIALVAGDTPQNQGLTAQGHTLGRRLNAAETEVKGHRVLDPLLVAQRHDQPVQRRLLRAPREHLESTSLEHVVRRPEGRP